MNVRVAVQGFPKREQKRKRPLRENKTGKREKESRNVLFFLRKETLANLLPLFIFFRISADLANNSFRHQQGLSHGDGFHACRVFFWRRYKNILKECLFFKYEYKDPNSHLLSSLFQFGLFRCQVCQVRPFPQLLMSLFLSLSQSEGQPYKHHTHGESNLYIQLISCEPALSFLSK